MSERNVWVSGSPGTNVFLSQQVWYWSGNTKPANNYLVGQSRRRDFSLEMRFWFLRLLRKREKAGNDRAAHSDLAVKLVGLSYPRGPLQEI